MDTLWSVASVRADVRSNRRIILSRLSADEGEKMYLLAEILGWEPFFVRRDNIACGSDGAGVGLPARLRLRQSGTIILVETDDAVLREQLARTGLDRLVPPVPLLALEQLLVFAD